MNNLNRTLVYGALLGLDGEVSAQSDQTDPVFAVRGLPVGISMEEFRKFPIVNDDGNTDLQTWCSNDTDLKAKKFYFGGDDRKLGVVECKWYSKRPDTSWSSVSEHWIDLGKGKGRLFLGSLMMEQA
ncbi:MAG: hypothetical protein AB8B54_08980 [Sphingorhabdus sp.]